MTDERQKTSAHDALRLYLKEHSMRSTPERSAILECVMEQAKHFTVDDIWSKMVDDNFIVSRSTVYNNMKLLADIGLIRPLSTASNVSSYERVGAATASHIHLVCTICGKVKEVRDSALMSSLAMRRYSAFHPAYASVNVYGVCSGCARGRKKKLKNNNTKK